METLKAENIQDMMYSNSSKIQLAGRLKKLACQAYQLMLKTRFFADENNTIQHAERYSYSIMESVELYIRQIHRLGDQHTSLSNIAQPFKVYSASSYMESLSDLVTLHKSIKREIVDIFVHFKESDFLDTFEFLRKQLFLHEEQLWEFRQLKRD